MRNTKREWMPLYGFLDRRRVTDHLSDMAAKGWMLDRLSSWSWRYRRTEPRKLRFAVTFFAGAGRFSPAPAEGLDTFQDYCAQAGWHTAASLDQVQVFYNEDPDAVPIETDPAAELENIRRSVGKPMVRSYLALLLPLMFSVYNLLIMKSYISGIPDSLIDAAKIDGCGEVRTLFQIILPLIKPALATVGLFIALAYWNDWYNAMLYIKAEDKYPLQYFLYQQVNNIEGYKQLIANSAVSGNIASSVSLPSETLKMALTVVVTGPIVLAYPLVQKYFVQGVTIGAVKG